MRISDDEAEYLMRSVWPRACKALRKRIGPHLRSRYDAEDFVADAFADLLAREETWQSDLQITRLLIRIAQRRLIDAHRLRNTAKHGAYREELVPDIRDVIGVAPGPLAQLEAAELWGRLIDRADDASRAILRLRREGYSSGEIGERMGCCERTVERRLVELRRTCGVE